MRSKFIVVILSLVMLLPTQSGNTDGLGAVVVSKEAIDLGKTQETLSVRELIDIFTKKRTYWDDRTEIIVITRKQTSIPNEIFLVDILGLTPFQYRTRLQRNIYRGRAHPPIEVSTEEEMFTLILSNDQAIGYIYNYILLKDEERLVIIHVTD